MYEGCKMLKIEQEGNGVTVSFDRPKVSGNRRKTVPPFENRQPEFTGH